jgi:chemotaxis protein MotB
MGSLRRQIESDEAPGAPEWMVTFSDCMTLLLTFFVLLLSFSSFDERTFRRLKWIFGEALPSVRPYTKEEKVRDKDAFLPTEQIKHTEEFDEASEKPTLEKGLQEGLKDETEPVDFYNRKVFLVSSQKVFWGEGTAISSQGRTILSTMASFIKEVPSLVVISENGPQDNESKDFGLLRAWAVMEYFTTKQGLDKNWFSVSPASNVSQESPKSSERGRPGPSAERMLEIILLERSICN